MAQEHPAAQTPPDSPPKRAPAFQFYAGDHLGDPRIALMTPAQEGAYIRLLAYAWMDPDGSLPDDDEALAHLSRLAEGWFGGGSLRVRSCFVVCDGRLRSPMLDRKRTRVLSAVPRENRGDAQRTMLRAAEILRQLAAPLGGTTA